MSAKPIDEKTFDAIGGAGGRPRYQVDEAALLTGLSPEELLEIRAALGRVRLGDDEAGITDVDLRITRNVAALSHFVGAEDQGIPPGLLRTLRTAAHSLRRVSEAHVTGLAEALGPGRLTAPELISSVERSAVIVREVLADLWIQAVNESVASLLSEVGDPTNPSLAVGFVDLSGFTARSQQLATDDLAELVDRFDVLGSAVLSEHRAVLVKTVGDEIMFVHRDPVVAVRCGCDLVARCERDERLLPARAGLTWGRPLRLAGDYYGPSVNLAARLVQRAPAGTVLIDAVLADRIAPVGEFTVHAMRPQRIRGCGTQKVFAIDVARSAVTALDQDLVGDAP